MLEHLTFTPGAFEIMNDAQKDALVSIMPHCKLIEVSKDVLYEKTLYVIIHYRNGNVIHGGITQEGSVHT